MVYIMRSPIEEQPSPFTVVGAQYFEPDTSDVLGAFVDEAFTGVGTGYADIEAFGVTRLKKEGTPLSLEQYMESPHHRKSIPYSRDMTDSSAKALAEFNDDQEENAFIISHATTAQTVAGYTAAFATGLFEPKNLATGIAASLALTPVIGIFAPAASSLRRIYQIKRASGRYKAKAVLGGAEGMAAATLAEPSNQYSAKILKQDYGMADTFLNIGLSTVFGAGFLTVPGLIKDKWSRHGSRTPDIVMRELDTAIGQLAEGRRVDVSVVEKAHLGEISKKPIAEQARAVEEVVRYTETPEFQARFEGSKVVDAEGAPLRVFHGTQAEFTEFSATGLETYFTTNTETANQFAKVRGDDGGNIRPAYLNIKKPVPRLEWLSNPDKQFWQKKGFDGAIIETTAKHKTFAVFEPDQIISPFGESKLPNLVAQVDTQTSTDISKSITDSVDPTNDTAIDFGAARELDELATRDVATQESFDRYLEEIAFMKKEGLLSEDEIAAFTDAINEVNEKDIRAAHDSLLTCLTRG